MAIVPKNRDKWGASSPTPKPDAAFVRLAHPSEQGVYYDKSTARWVRSGWTVWTYEDWQKRFGNEEDTRKWEFFGYRISIAPKEDLG